MSFRAKREILHKLLHLYHLRFIPAIEMKNCRSQTFWETVLYKVNKKTK